jgi:agmatinase
MKQAPYNFMNIPRGTCEPSKARYAVLPVPYEGTVTFMQGTVDAPAAIVDASAQVEEFDEELARDFRAAGIITLSPILPAKTPEEQMRRVASVARTITSKGKFLLTLGGEHSITAPLVRAIAEQHSNISVLQIDAHADLRDTYDGSPCSHACVMRRVLEVTDRIAQVGIRNYSQQEYVECPRQVSNFITPAMVENDPGWMDRVLSLLDEKVYVTVDVDGFDPAYVPGTGTPEPGGLTWRQVTGLLRRVCTERLVVGADIVEVIPIPGQKVSEFLAARLAYKIIAYVESFSQGGNSCSRQPPSCSN